MAFQLELKQPGAKFEILSSKAISLFDQVALDLFKVIHAMNEKVAMLSLEFVRVPEDDNAYRYSIVLNDGRRWHQGLFFANKQKPSMTFSVPDKWELAEFALQRPIRDGLVALVQEFEAISVVVSFVS